MPASLLAKTTDIKYTMAFYEYDVDFLKSVGLYHAAHPNAIAGVIMSDKYRAPPQNVVKEDGKKAWRATPVKETSFMEVLASAGHNGNWVVLNGGPRAVDDAMIAITSETKWAVEEYNIYSTQVGLVAVVTQKDTGEEDEE